MNASQGRTLPGNGRPACRPAGDERPRERLFRHGARALADSELVAILIANGSCGSAAVEVARQILHESAGLPGLAGASAESLRRPGLGAAKAAALLAAVELATRLARSAVADREPLGDPDAVARYLALRFGAPDQEVFGGLYLDARNRLLVALELYRGTLNRAAVEPRALLKQGLLHGAAGIVAFHNHPSGDPSPSAEDLAFTRRLAEAGETVGVRLVDHLIVGSGGRWISLRQRGAL